MMNPYVIKLMLTLFEGDRNIDPVARNVFGWS
jgi:hypothetical protein